MTCARISFGDEPWRLSGGLNPNNGNFHRMLPPRVSPGRYVPFGAEPPGFVLVGFALEPAAEGEHAEATIPAYELFLHPDEAPGTYPVLRRRHSDRARTRENTQWSWTLPVIGVSGELDQRDIDLARRLHLRAHGLEP